MKFTKMHGIGNDYVYINCLEEKVDDPEKLSKFISDRHFGVGSDGLVLILPSSVADFRMRMFNPDGTESEMCGNAIRCVGKFVYDNGMTDSRTVSVETPAGIKRLELAVDQENRVSSIRVDMGEPVLNPQDIPVNSVFKRFVNIPVNVQGTEYRITCVSMGNPHAVAYVDDVADFPLKEVGPLIENHCLFPKKINVEFVEVIDRTHLKVRVWERGTGETLACGTGACAVLVASNLNGLCGRKARVELPGGVLEVEWNEENNHVYKTGPAAVVYTGCIRIPGTDC